MFKDAAMWKTGGPKFHRIPNWKHLCHEQYARMRAYGDRNNQVWEMSLGFLTHQHCFLLAHSALTKRHDPGAMNCKDQSENPYEGLLSITSDQGLRKHSILNDPACQTYSKTPRRVGWTFKEKPRPVLVCPIQGSYPGPKFSVDDLEQMEMRNCPEDMGANWGSYLGGKESPTSRRRQYTSRTYIPPQVSTAAFNCCKKQDVWHYQELDLYIWLGFR